MLFCKWILGMLWKEVTRASSASGRPPLCRELGLEELQALQAQLESAAAAVREQAVQRRIAAAAAEAAAQRVACSICAEREVDIRLECGHLLCMLCTEQLVESQREPCCPSCRHRIGVSRDAEGRLVQCKQIFL